MPSNMSKSLKLENNTTLSSSISSTPKMKPIDQQSRVAQEFIHLRDPDSLYKARTPTTIAELETVLRDSLLALCNTNEDPAVNKQQCEEEIQKAMNTRPAHANLVLNFSTTKIKCERLLTCAGALMSKQVRSVADEAIGMFEYLLFNRISIECTW